MPRLSIRLRYVSSLLTALALLGCQTEATAPADRHVSRSDLDFVTGLTNLVEFDRRVIGSEMGRSADPRVAVLARDLLARVEAFNTQVQAIATRDGIVPPRDVTLVQQSDAHSRIATLMATSHYDFDREFVADELAGNQQTLRQAQQVIQEPSGDPALRALLQEAVSRLQENVARLTTLQTQLQG